MGASRWGRQKNAILNEYVALLEICILVLTAYLPRNADCSISWSFPYQFAQTRTQYSNEGPQHWNAVQFLKTLSKCGFYRRKTVVLAFLRGISSKFAAVSKINKWRQGHLSYGHVMRWATVTWYAYIFAGYDDYFVFFGDRYCCMLLRIITRLHGSVTSVVRVTPHTKRGAYSIVNGDRCSASHYNYQNRIRSVRIFANCLSIVQY